MRTLVEIGFNSLSSSQQIYNRLHNFAVIRFPCDDDGREKMFPRVVHRALEVHLQGGGLVTQSFNELATTRHLEPVYWTSQRMFTGWKFYGQ